MPDPKTQFKIVFEPIMNIPDEFMSAIMQRHEEAKSTIDFPYQPAEEVAPTPKRGSRAAAAVAAVAAVAAAAAAAAKPAAKPVAKRGARKY